MVGAAVAGSYLVTEKLNDAGAGAAGRQGRARARRPAALERESVNAEQTA